MNIQQKMRNLSWLEIYQLSQSLIGKLPKLKWTGILAITRGGLVPAGILAQHMEIRRLEVVNIKSYENKKQGTIEFMNAPNIDNEGENWLVIDDLSDTGKTLVAIKKKFPKAFYTTLIVKPEGEFATDLYVEKVDQDIWLVFPWEPK